MMQEGLRQFTQIPLTVFGMMLFLFTYLAVIAWTLLGKSTQHDFEALANMPLHEEDRPHD